MDEGVPISIAKFEFNSSLACIIATTEDQHWLDDLCLYEYYGHGKI